MKRFWLFLIGLCLLGQDPEVTSKFIVYKSTALSGADDTFYQGASNLMAAASFADSGALFKSKIDTADNTVAAITADTNYGDATLPILKLNGTANFRICWVNNAP